MYDKGEIELSERELKIKIAENAETIAKILSKGKDCEIRKSASGISIAEIGKKVVKR